jgi:hypothetical protein
MTARTQVKRLAIALLPILAAMLLFSHRVRLRTDALGNYVPAYFPGLYLSLLIFAFFWTKDLLVWFQSHRLTRVSVFETLPPPRPMIHRRKRTVILGLSVVLGLFFVCLFLLRPDDPLSVTTFDRIELGANEGEVDKIVRIRPVIPGKGPKRNVSRLDTVKKAGVFAVSNVNYIVKDGEDGSVLFVDVKDGRVFEKAKFWDSPGFSLIVTFGADGKVINKWLSQCVYEDEPILDLLWRWFGLN